MIWRRMWLPIALASLVAGCAMRQSVPTADQGLQLVHGRLYSFIYSCQQPFGCTGEVAEVAAGPHDGWVLLADGRALNIRQVLAILPYVPPAEEPVEESPALQVQR